MKLTILVDNNTMINRYFIGEPGLSFLIEDAGKKILFDVGYSDAMLKNAAKMNISLLDIDYIVLSHGHLDHTWGLVPLIAKYTEAALEKIPFKRPKLLTHPQTFNSKSSKDLNEIGSILSREKLARHFDIKLAEEPFELTGNLVFLGEIPRTNSFEAKKSLGKVMEPSQPPTGDYLKEDSALAYRSPQGLVIITGCSHSGICNIIEHGRKVCGDDRVLDIIGGFHLLNPPGELLAETLLYLKKLVPRSVHACHCTDLCAKIALSRTVSLEEVGVGSKFDY